MLILFNLKLILVWHNLAVFAYLVASCNINTVIFLLLLIKPVISIFYISGWLAVFVWAEERKMPGGILRKSWSLNNSGALQQAREASGWLRYLPGVQHDWQGMGPALPHALVNRMVTGDVQLIGLLLKEWGKGWGRAGEESLSFPLSTHQHFKAQCSACLPFAESQLGVCWARKMTGAKMVCFFHLNKACTAGADITSCFCKLWQPWRSVCAGVLLVSIAKPQIQCRQGSLG